jgi:hypothetical protein
MQMTKFKMYLNFKDDGKVTGSIVVGATRVPLVLMPEKDGVRPLRALISEADKKWDTVGDIRAMVFHTEEAAQRAQPNAGGSGKKQLPYVEGVIDLGKAGLTEIKGEIVGFLNQGTDKEGRPHAYLSFMEKVERPQENQPVAVGAGNHPEDSNIPF